SKYRSDGAAERIAFLVSQIEPEDVENLWQWLESYGNAWREALDFGDVVGEITPVNRDAFSTEAIIRALNEINGHIHRRKGKVPVEQAMRDIAYRGLILTSDHAASAGADAFPDIELSREIALRPIGEHKLRHHQSMAEQLSAGNALMIAPTGSGKTEAAMLWAAMQHQQREVSRLFYTLPYQASMNAMQDRLIHKFYATDSDHNQQVTIQHSRATLKFYRDRMNADSGINTREASGYAKAQKNITGLNYFPVQVFSPYQMLKATYRLRGYEPLLVDYAGALFIFDEIHAYEPERLALIIATMEWLYRQFDARFLVMTATLPPMVQNALCTALDISEAHIVTADNETFKQSQRHNVVLHDGDLLAQLDVIVASYEAGQSVLVVCNQVAHAQAAYQQLQQAIPAADLRMLHGRFNGKDRSEKERWLLERVGVRVGERKPTVFVATQVVEVSLDVDFDILHTDPAPIEALLQRF
ncbi:MAG: CRISPR-associated helicase Cas3', partial [Chloroflexota bacterium]